MTVRRFETGQRMSQAVVHGNTVYLAGQTGKPGDGVARQMADILAEVERLLALAGSDKTRILQAVIWLADIGDFDEMNAVWENWITPGHAPVRTIGQAKLADPGERIEVVVTASSG